MNDLERKALRSIRLNWAPTPDDVWRSQSELHAHSLHDSALTLIMEAFDDADASSDASPIGVAMRGEAGSGKTHLLGQVRERVQNSGGYFFLIGLLDSTTFWQTTLVGMLDDLTRPAPEQDTQLKLFLWRLASTAHISRADRRAIIGEDKLTPETLDKFVSSVHAIHPRLIKQSQSTLRALTIYATTDLSVHDIGNAFLQSIDEVTVGARTTWGIQTASLTPQQVVRDISRLLAATGPSVLAVDQIDTLLAQSRSSTDGSIGAEHETDLVLEQVAHGLMALRENLGRTASVVACLPSVWELIQSRATRTVSDRFRVTPPLKGLPKASIAEEILERRFQPKYSDIGFEPPYPTWPVAKTAFDTAEGITPRQLMINVDKHIRRCLETNSVVELTDLLGDNEHVTVGTGNESELVLLDTQFEEFRKEAVTNLPTSHKFEDKLIPPLLSAGLTAWIKELGDIGDAFSLDNLPSAKPALHARLRQKLDPATEDEQHWAFRAIASESAVAVLNRLRAACTTAGLHTGISRRKLFVIRNVAWSKGPKTAQAVNEFEQAGGRTLRITEDELASLSALNNMLDDGSPLLDAWLTSRQPAHRIKVLLDALEDQTDSESGLFTVSEPGPDVTTEEHEGQPPLAEPEPELVIDPRAVPLGGLLEGDGKLHVDLEALRKHTAIFAGSGSGKTVLIRRLVEECALRGVSAIVLDPNNDLARLGIAWPTPPPHWDNAEVNRAADYHANTEVVVWTPRRSAGRPISFQPLPDFTSVVDFPDEFSEAIDSAVATLAPRALISGKTAKASQATAVLRQALEHFGRNSGSSLVQLIDLLSELPDYISDLENSEKIAADIAQNLRASMVNDPMFGGEGTPVDPGLLLTPSAGKRARISVISMVGLPSDEQRQSFVNQLQMALFAWIKKNPAGEKPLGGLFVMDEAQTLAPSGAMTACTQSTLALASQARKYGLGLVFATQAPKGLNNRIPGNAATQFFGFLNSPVQIDAAKEMAQAKGSSATDIGRLKTGQFYAAVEGEGFNKIQAPLCLSYHPKSPLTSEEVIELAHRPIDPRA
ncbi:AAA family ATPase [Rhodococcus sp. EPR-157]|uniref:ATP-binding protein n=1 Tax=Rhodococcus sp. EPR-157 TaxID=1813677 RepID=UPI0007BAE651|nr:ATP-binding protein [Rhodococcus sp. EPR-157]KZF03884.1 AAA family ATPase [Rhodococcus sp. EPR-157]